MSSKMSVAVVAAGLLTTVAQPAGSQAHPKDVQRVRPVAAQAPALFAEGIVSTGDNEFSTTFTPDGRGVFWTVSAPNVQELPFAILFSHKENGKWSAPRVASFSGTPFSDADPAIAPDGKTLYFMSRRPLTGSTAKPDFDIWMFRHATHELRRIDEIDTDAQELFPSVTADGTLYFTSDRAGGKGSTDVYRARLVDGKYAPPENIGGPVNTDAGESNVMVSPDERFIIFASVRPTGAGKTDLYYSERAQDGTWSAPRALGGGVNSPEDDYAPGLSPDGKLLYFSSRRTRPGNAGTKDYAQLRARYRGAGNGNADVYVVPLAAALQ